MLFATLLLAVDVVVKDEAEFPSAARDKIVASMLPTVSFAGANLVRTAMFSCLSTRVMCVLSQT